MAEKRDLFKQLGWSDELIEHFTINDDNSYEPTVSDFSCTVCDSTVANLRFDNSSEAVENLRY